MKISLEIFENRFTQHAFAMANSLEYQKLEYLSQLIVQWTVNFGVNAEAVGMVG